MSLRPHRRGAHRRSKGRLEVPAGTKGSIRLDLIGLDKDGRAAVIYDLKTGKAKLTASRIKQIQDNLPEPTKD